MPSTRHISSACICLCLEAASLMAGSGEKRNATEPVGGLFMGPSVFDTPFSADATTTVMWTFGNGRRLDQSTTSRYYRDRLGRVRVEQRIFGAQPKTMSERHLRILVDSSPGLGTGVATLDPVTRTVRALPREIAAEMAGGAGSIAVPVGGVRFVTFRRAQDWLREDARLTGRDFVQEEALGNRRIAGVETTGRRITFKSEAGQTDRDGPVEVVDERWESPDLRIVIYARSSDSRSGVIEYRVSNIRREEPPPDLFVVPPGYTFESTNLSDPWWLQISSDGYESHRLR